MPLGTAFLKVRVKGCDDDLHIGGYLEEPFEQNGYEKVYNNVPAQFLEVNVETIKDDKGVDIFHLLEFFNSEDPVVRSINLLSTAEEDELEDKLIAEEDGGDTGKETSEVKDKQDYKATEASKETIRFQYNGLLEMEVEVLGDDLECNDYPSGDFDSFHVVEYMSLIDIKIDLRFKLDDDLYCNIVDPGQHKLSIVSNLGMDSNAGFDDFYNSLPSDQQKELISACSTIAPPSGEASGPCLLDINSGESGSGKEIKLTVGRPNINDPYTKNVNIRVIGAANNVQHRAEFFIEGQFSLGAGDSFALPTHQPIMVLRDPPVSISSCVYLIFNKGFI